MKVPTFPLKLKIRWRKYYSVLIGLALLLILYQYLLTDGGIKLEEILITEDAYFNPFCVSNQNLSEFPKFNTDEFCQEIDNGVIRLGSSENAGVGSDTYTRYLYLKLQLDKIPQSSFFHQVTIQDAKLILKTSYSENQSNPGGDFIIFNGMCLNNTWAEDSKHSDFPCLTKYHKPLTIFSSYSEPLFANIIKQTTIDLDSQIKYATTNNLNSFTEIVEFVPILHLIDKPFTENQRLCMYEASTRYELDDCIRQNRILVHTSEHSSVGLRPTLLVQYEKEITAYAQAINTAILAFVPIISSVIIYWDRQKDSEHRKMVRVCNTLLQEINDFHNGLTSNDYERSSKISMGYKNGLKFCSIKLPKPISMAILSVDAYNEIINSGSFENFQPIHQTEISTLYNHVKVYNEEFSEFRDLLDKYYILAGDPKEFKMKREQYEYLIELYGSYLGNVREEILSRIDEVISIIDQEKEANA